MVLLTASLGVACLRPTEGAARTTDTMADADIRADGHVTTENVLCGHSDSGTQELVYATQANANPTPIDEILDYSFSWTCGTQRTLTGNGIPNHGVPGGVFKTPLSARTVIKTFPLKPVLGTAVTEVAEPGFALNGIKFSPKVTGICGTSAVSASDCYMGMDLDEWWMVATPGNASLPWEFAFGLDENHGHAHYDHHTYQMDTLYHYHGIPTGLVAKLNPNSATSMTLVGWAIDGFPMYSVQGYADATDPTSGVVDMRSSFELVETPAAGRPAVAQFPLGHFAQDWTYIGGSGDLDECNGRFGVTPEFPDGIYHYHLTRTFPFVQHCVKGLGVEGNGPRVLQSSTSS